MKKAVVLLSGGLDSTTCLALAQSLEYSSYALSFSYGQKHGVELLAAKKVALLMGVASHKVVDLDTDLFSGSALTEPNVEVPEFQEGEAIPLTYVPARNTIFLSMALGYAESLGAKDIFIGASSVDYSHYPDCRPEFIEAFQILANLATKTAVQGAVISIHAPLQYLSKMQTIELGLQLGVDYSLTVSCYQANAGGEACGYCDSCVLRKKGFASAGVEDPTCYRASG